MVRSKYICFSYFLDGVVLIEPDYVKDGKKGNDVSNTMQNYQSFSLCGLI